MFLTQLCSHPNIGLGECSSRTRAYVMCVVRACLSLTYPWYGVCVDVGFLSSNGSLLSLEPLLNDADQLARARSHRVLSYEERSWILFVRMFFLLQF
jgi:hypothetical protein